MDEPVFCDYTEIRESLRALVGIKLAKNGSQVDLTFLFQDFNVREIVEFICKNNLIDQLVKSWSNQFSIKLLSFIRIRRLRKLNYCVFMNLGEIQPSFGTTPPLRWCLLLLGRHLTLLLQVLAARHLPHPTENKLHEIHRPLQ